MLKVTFTAEDKFAQLMGIGANDVMLPRQLLTKADFQDMPDANVDRPAPVPYGDLSTVASTLSPPVLTGTTSLGGIVGADGNWMCGFGHLACLATPPTSITATAQSGGTLSTNRPNPEYGVMISVVDPNGNESDPKPYHDHYVDGGHGSFANANANGLGFAYDEVDGTQKLHVAWSGATGPVTKYRVYLGEWYYGFRPLQWIETTATSCDFTACPAFGTALTTSNITPGAHLVTFSAIWIYAVSAIAADGETGLSTEVTAVIRCYDRPARIEWLPVAGATGYRVYKRGAGGTWFMRFDVGAQEYFDDDLTNVGGTPVEGQPQPTGLVPCLHVGTRKDLHGFTWQAFCVAGCAIKSIEKVYKAGAEVDAGNFLTTWAVPSKGGIFTSEFGWNTFVDINGHRYTLLYVRGPEGDECAAGAQITVTLKGIETSGNGTGTLITHLADQYEHWLRNFALRDRSTVAPWDFDGPMWNDSPNDVDLVDAGSFATVKTVWGERDAGNCPGAWVMGLGETGQLEQVSVRTVAARLNQSLDVFSGWTRKSQYAVKIINENVDLSQTPRYTATIGINAGTFKIADDPSMMENQITTSYALVAPKSEWSTILTEDINAQAVIGEVKPYELKLWCIRRLDVAADIARRRLARKKFPYRIVSWESDMGALSVDLGDIVRISHPDGAGLDGWTDRAVFILRHEFDPQRFAIALEALDLDAVIAQLADRVVVLSVGTLSLTGGFATLDDSLRLAPAAASVGVTGQAPTVV